MRSFFHTNGLQGFLFLKHLNNLIGEDPKGKIFYEKYKRTSTFGVCYALVSSPLGYIYVSDEYYK